MGSTIQGIYLLDLGWFKAILIIVQTIFIRGDKFPALQSSCMYLILSSKISWTTILTPPPLIWIFAGSPSHFSTLGDRPTMKTVYAPINKLVNRTFWLLIGLEAKLLCKLETRLRPSVVFAAYVHHTIQPIMVSHPHGKLLCTTHNYLKSYEARSINFFNILYFQILLDVK